MTTRILPPAEWPRLAGTEAASVWPQLDPARTTIVVAERDGQIVGCHVLSWMLHAECLWIAPECRGKSSAARRLWAAVQQTVRGHWRAHGFVTGAVDSATRELLAHVGAERLPGDQYLVRLVKGPTCQLS